MCKKYRGKDPVWSGVQSQDCRDFRKISQRKKRWHGIYTWVRRGPNCWKTPDGNGIVDTGRYLVIVRTGFERINWNFTGGFQTEPRGDAWNWSLRQPIEAFSLFPRNSVRRSPFVVHRLLRPPMVLFQTHTHTHTHTSWYYYIVGARNSRNTVPDATHFPRWSTVEARTTRPDPFFRWLAKNRFIYISVGEYFPEVKSKLSVLFFG